MEKHLIMERIIAVKINNLTEKISLRILITRQLGESYLALGGKKEYIQNDVSSFFNHTTSLDDSKNVRINSRLQATVWPAK